MIKKVLIANRGEVAVRIIRACRELGIISVAIYSETDKEALHTQLADEAICIGPSSSRDSYLNIPNILEATALSGAEAIHPGFGFLSENSKFAKMCGDCNITFIGPSYKTMDLMGDKANARRTMKENGIPIVDGYEGHIKDENHALDIAKKIGTVGYMCALNRTKVGEFSIEQAITIEELKNTNKENLPIITIEKLFEKHNSINLEEQKLKLLLNGVKLTRKEKDGIYRIYNNQKFIGIGVIENQLLKRDIII